MSRGNFKFNRGDAHERASSERVSWLDSFADNLAAKEKGNESAVDVGRKRSQQSLYDQINYVVRNKPHHATVESAVKELQDRVGLTEYLKRVSSGDEGAQKTAQQEEDVFDADVPASVQDEIKTFIKNYIKTHRGQISVPAVQSDAAGVFKKYISPDQFDSDKVAIYINNLITEEIKLNPSDNA